MQDHGHQWMWQSQAAVDCQFAHKANTVQCLWTLNCQQSYDCLVFHIWTVLIYIFFLVYFFLFSQDQSCLKKRMVCLQEWKLIKLTRNSFHTELSPDAKEPLFLFFICCCWCLWNVQIIVEISCSERQVRHEQLLLYCKNSSGLQ